MYWDELIAVAQQRGAQKAIQLSATIGAQFGIATCLVIVRGAE
jgi:hypothetical protein